MLDDVFDELTAILDIAGIKLHASELHGEVCGVLAGGREILFDPWLQSLMEDEGVTKPFDEQDTQALERVLTESSQSMRDEAMGFQLLLPDDDYPLTERAMALKHWVQGFLTEYGLNGIERTDPESEEILKDFVAISQLEEAMDESEAREKDFMEISEYVRIATLTLFNSNSAQGVLEQP